MEGATGPRLGVFGGSFDPPHLSHVMVVAWALTTGQVDRVLVVPAALHAFGKAFGATYQQRLEMCRLALSLFAPGTVEVSDIEGQRDGVSYTIDSLRTLREQRPSSPLRLIIGSDIVSDLPKWRDSAEVQRLAPPLVAPRLQANQSAEAVPGALPMLSSTFVRTRLGAGEDASGLVPASVVEFIQERGLYRNS